MNPHDIHISASDSVLKVLQPSKPPLAMNIDILDFFTDISLPYLVLATSAVSNTPKVLYRWLLLPNIGCQKVCPYVL